MTQNYKWYRLLSEGEFDAISWKELLVNHGMSKKLQRIYLFAPELFENPLAPAYMRYVEWWNRHFGTKLSRHLYGVEDVD